MTQRSNDCCFLDFEQVIVGWIIFRSVKTFSNQQNNARAKAEWPLLSRSFAYFEQVFVGRESALDIIFVTLNRFSLIEET